MDPDKRITISGILAHPWFDDVPEDQIRALGEEHRHGLIRMSVAGKLRHLFRDVQKSWEDDDVTDEEACKKHFDAMTREVDEHGEEYITEENFVIDISKLMCRILNIDEARCMDIDVAKRIRDSLFPYPGQEHWTLKWLFGVIDISKDKRMQYVEFSELYKVSIRKTTTGPVAASECRKRGHPS